MANLSHPSFPSGITQEWRFHMSDKYNLTLVADVFAKASGLTVTPGDIQPVEKAEYRGSKFVNCLDVYAFMVHNNDSSHTIYFYSPERPCKGVKIVEVTENPENLIYQRGLATHVGDQYFFW